MAYYRCWIALTVSRQRIVSGLRLCLMTLHPNCNPLACMHYAEKKKQGWSTQFSRFTAAQVCSNRLVWSMLFGFRIYVQSWNKMVSLFTLTFVEFASPLLLIRSLRCECSSSSLMWRLFCCFSISMSRSAVRSYARSITEFKISTPTR